MNAQYTVKGEYGNDFIHCQRGNWGNVLQLEVGVNTYIKSFIQIKG